MTERRALIWGVDDRLAYDDTKKKRYRPGKPSVNQADAYVPEGRNLCQNREVGIVRKDVSVND